MEQYTRATEYIIYEEDTWSCVFTRDEKFVFAVGSHAVTILFGGLVLRVGVLIYCHTFYQAHHTM